MISIFIMYSKDRKKALDYTLSCLRDMTHYEHCQKTLIVDGKIDVTPHDCEVIQVPRINGKFSWGRMWDAGVGSAINDTVLYLDSDRLLPKDFLASILNSINDNCFIYTSRHYHMLEETPIQVCKKALSSKNFEIDMAEPSNVGKFRFEVRVGQPYHGPSKNVMSGSTAFKKRTYFRVGGVDHWYTGHGAFADTDFHQQAAVAGCQFVDLALPELHFPHTKLAESNRVLLEGELQLLSLNNFIYYCKKWRLPIALAETLAARSGIERPSRYVAKRLKELN